MASPLLLTVQRTWQHALAQYSPMTIEFVGTLGVQFLFFWLPCAGFYLLEHLAPTFSQRHKLQPAPKQPTPAELRECLAVVLRNQVLSTVIHIALLSAAALAPGPPAVSFSFSPRLPGLAVFARDLLVSILAREALFYYAHRLLHHPSLYPRVHKLHHRFTAPVALAAQYAHPIEHFLANTLPITLPPMLLGAHIVTFWVFLASQLLETTTVHSGFDFLSGAARKHDLHHERFVVNFGAIGLLDWLHGTDGKSRERRRAAKKDM